MTHSIQARTASAAFVRAPFLALFGRFRAPDTDMVVLFWTKPK